MVREIQEGEPFSKAQHWVREIQEGEPFSKAQHWGEDYLKAFQLSSRVGSFSRSVKSCQLEIYISDFV
jgi:hypothetical protein